MNRLLMRFTAVLLLPVLFFTGCSHEKSGKIVFRGPTERGMYYLYTVNPDDGDTVKLARWMGRSMPYFNSWSSDGKLLAFVDTDNETDGYWLSVFDFERNTVTRLLDLTDLSCHSFTMCPNGKAVIVSLDSTRTTRTETPRGSTVHLEITQDFDSDLFRVAIPGGKLTRITDTPDVRELYPSCSPDGRYIAFIGQIDTETSKNVARDIFIMDRNGNNRKHLIHHAEGWGIYYTELQWSPDSRYIAYSYANVPISDDEDYSDIFVIDVKKGTLTNITDTPAIGEYEPQWSPDGRKMVFYSVENKWDYRTVIYDFTDGTTTGFDQPLSSWTLDGKGLIFANPQNVGEIMETDIETGIIRSLVVTGNISVSRPFWIR